MPNRIEELFAELAESVGGQQQFQIDQQLRQQEAERELYDTDEARTALEIAGIIGLMALTKGRSGGKGLPLNKGYGAVGGDIGQQILSKVGSKLPGRSGARVGTDVAGRVPLPTAKAPVMTTRGPRGPTNIDSPKQMPLPLSGGRSTGGISATERAQLPQTGGGITATKTARGDKEFLDKIMSSVRKDIAEEASKINIKGVRFSRKEWDDMLDETAAEKLGLSLAKYRQKMNARSKLRRWKKGHEDKVRRGDAQYQEGSRSGYEPDIKGGEKMMRESRKRIQEIQAKLDELNKLL